MSNKQNADAVQSTGPKIVVDQQQTFDDEQQPVQHQRQDFLPDLGRRALHLAPYNSTT
ncbi:hypothetical protein BCR43DRAFT_515326 [Syncephalastrum racemosum]|uniref:Uncharacterized protein n=1 Tax=Syncephalastrum racemosum TaxID=13706 RepID=A0A1X2HDR9_SYNRA|nr:hypothetical protein BCR43DRAFT_515326 [Syncephalastrum racemosum]